MTKSHWNIAKELSGGRCCVFATTNKRRKHVKTALWSLSPLSHDVLRPGLQQSEIWLQGFCQQVHGPCQREWSHLCPHVLRESRCWLASLWQGCQIYHVIEMEILSRQEQTLDRFFVTKQVNWWRGSATIAFGHILDGPFPLLLHNRWTVRPWPMRICPPSSHWSGDPTWLALRHKWILPSANQVEPSHSQDIQYLRANSEQF